MQLGIVGLGRMGGNIAKRLMRDGHVCVAWDRDPKGVAAIVEAGAKGAKDLKDLVRQLAAPRSVWIMLPAGAPTEETVAALADLLEPGDAIIDGGNSFYRDDIFRAKTLRAKQLHYLDVGVSGGVWGLERGYCMMIGGPQSEVDRLDPIFRSLAPGLGDIPRTERPADADPRAELGYIHAGPTGAGHFVKMIHNGIEYGLMQAYAEGFDILRGKGSDKLPEDERFDLDLSEIACKSSPNSDWRITSNPSAYACISPYSMPLWIIFTK